MTFEKANVHQKKFLFKKKNRNLFKETLEEKRAKFWCNILV
jgi:hypothetical protein